MSAVEGGLASLVAGPLPSQWSGTASELALAAIGDTFAVGVAGRDEQQTRMAAAALVAPAGEPMSLGDRAFLAGVACHALDWDDYMHPMHGHCSSVLLPVAWTLGLATGASGRELLEAFLVGYQVDYELGLLFDVDHYERGWHATSTVGTVGAAATASRLLGLDADGSTAAMAMAASFASGLKVNFGTDTKAIHAGAAARNGVTAALLARAGLDGARAWLTGRAGMLETFGGAVASGLAEEVWRGRPRDVHGIETGWGLAQKPYTCCGSCHAALDAVIDVARRAPNRLTETDEIELHVDPIVTRLMSVDDPTSPVAARYSLSWATAAAFVDLDAGPAQFSAHALQREDIQHARRRLRVVADLDNPDLTRFAAHVVLRSGGQELRCSMPYGRGHPANPLTTAEREAKQRRALVPVLGGERTAVVVAALRDLPRVEDLRSLQALADLAPPDVREPHLRE